MTGSLKGRQTGLQPSTVSPTQPPTKKLTIIWIGINIFMIKSAGLDWWPNNELIQLFCSRTDTGSKYH